MANKKDLTIAELKEAVKNAKETFDSLNDQLTIAIREEEERRKAQLALDKEARKQEVDEAVENVKELIEAYVEDYGSYSSKYNSASCKHIFPFWF